MSDNFYSVFESLRQIHKWTSSIEKDMDPGEKEKASGEIMMHMHSLFKKLNIDFSAISEHFQTDSQGEETINQVALLSIMANCFINLTHFLKDNEFSVDEYAEFINDLACVGEQGSRTYFEDLNGKESGKERSIHKINEHLGAIKNIVSDLLT